MQEFLDRLVMSDLEWWFAINQVHRNGFLDAVMPWLRNPITWAPLYLFLLVFMLQNYGKQAWLWMLFFVITFGIGDFLSASIIKPWIHRPRPCNDELLSQVDVLLVHCGSGYSFPSTHATNHFALAFFMIFSLKPTSRYIKFLLFLWAFSISYAQVYVGVHYPVDVLAGGLLGILIGTLTGWVFRVKFPLTLV